MSTSLLVSQECSGGLTNDVDSSLSPRNGGGILVCKNSDLLPIDNHTLSELLHGHGESEVSGIVPELVDEIIQIHERIIDGSDVHRLLVFEGCSEDEFSNTTESVNS